MLLSHGISGRDAESRLIIVPPPIDIVMARSLEARTVAAARKREAHRRFNVGPYADGSHRRVLISRDLKIRSH